MIVSRFVLAKPFAAKPFAAKLGMKLKRLIEKDFGLGVIFPSQMPCYAPYLWDVGMGSLCNHASRPILAMLNTVSGRDKLQDLLFI